MKTAVLLPWIVLVLLVGMEIGAELCLEQYVKASDYKWVLGGVLLYLLVPFAFLYVLMNHDSLVVANTLWQVGNIIGLSVVGYFVLHEKLSATQWVGVGLATLAAVCMLVEP